jgi:hypothetical protein
MIAMKKVRNALALGLLLERAVADAGKPLVSEIA